jgi:hypothetical protein
MEGLGCGADFMKKESRKRIIFYSVAAVTAAGLTAMILPAASRPSNCGGNSYALNACQNYSLTARMAAEENHSQFETINLSTEDKVYLARLAKSGWIGGADFFIKTNFTCTNGVQEIVIVCEKQFDNVPQPTISNFYQHNPAYAAGYSDGTKGLISPEQFRSLNFIGFIRLSSLDTNEQTR